MSPQLMQGSRGIARCSALLATVKASRPIARPSVRLAQQRRLKCSSAAAYDEQAWLHSSSSPQSEAETQTEQHPGSGPRADSSAGSTNWKEMLWDALHSTAPPSRFTCSGSIAAKSIPWPGPEITVAGVGRLALPLSKEQAITLKSVAEQAPYGKGLETVVDTSVRDAFQVDASQVTINRTWSTALEPAVEEVANSLDMVGRDGACGISAHLYKLLLYEPGGHFVAHQDTEKEKGMIGTLVVQLPTVEGHTGGHLAVRHKGREIIHDFQEGSANSVKYAAFFADCEHELSPITGGMRLVLVYNLVWIGPKHAAPSLTPTSPVQAQLQQAIQAWERDIAIGCPQKRIALLLDHDYTEANLSFDHLKGTDRAWGRAVAACRQLDAYLVIYKRTVEGSYAYETRIKQPRRRRRRLDGNEDGGYSVSKWNREQFHVMEDEHNEQLETGLFIAQDGSSIVYDDIDPDIDLYDPDYLELFCEDDDPSQERYTAYTGNLGPYLTHIYNRALLVLWPRSHSMARAQQAGVQATAVLANLRLDEAAASISSTTGSAKVVVTPVKSEGQQQQQQQSSSHDDATCDSTSVSATAKAEALAALQASLRLLEQDTANNDGIPTVLQQAARAVDMGIEGASEVVQKLVAGAMATPGGITTAALASALADAAGVLDSAVIDLPLQKLVRDCVATQPSHCITLITGVSGQHELQIQLAATALSALPPTMVKELLSLAMAVPELPVVQQHVVQKLKDALSGPHCTTVLKRLTVHVHKLLEPNPEPQLAMHHELLAAVVTAVIQGGPVQYLSSCPKILQESCCDPVLRERLVQAVTGALCKDWPWQVSTVLELLPALEGAGSTQQLKHESDSLKGAMLEGLFSNYGLLSGQTDDSMLQLSELLLSSEQYTAAYYSDFATAVVNRPDNYNLLKWLLQRVEIPAMLTWPGVQKMVACQINTLEQADELPFSWDMPKARLRKFPEVETFLRSPREKFQLKGFSGITKAEEVAATFTEYASCDRDYFKQSKLKR